MKQNGSETFGLGTQFEALDLQNTNIGSYLKRFEHRFCSAFKISDEQKLSFLDATMGSKAYNLLKNACLPELLSSFSYT